ncbi:MAG: DPP IV N-terminal domain-containing protein [Candidatus Aminicenantes bacterium]|nr:DPP IV N-terminal domain-containing protein [Candidatus Aminicenantes bacterium]
MRVERFLRAIRRLAGAAGRSTAHPVVLMSILVALFGFLSCGQGDTARRDPGAGSRGAIGPQEAEIPISGRIVFQSDLDGDDEIYLLQGRRIEKLTDNTWDDRYPRWSPDGEKIAYTANPRGNFDVFVRDMSGGKVSPLTDSPEDEVDVAWFPDGTGIAYSAEFKKTLGKKRSIERLDLASGERSRLLPGFSGSHQLPDLSPRLPQVAFTGKKGLGWDVFLGDLKDQSIRQMTLNGKGCRPRFSPDGQRIAYVSAEADGKGDIWIMGVDGREPRRLTLRSDAFDYFPSWSPDGARIVFCSNLKDKYADKGEWGLYLIDLDGGRVTRLFDSPGRDVFPDWH